MSFAAPSEHSLTRRTALVTLGLASGSVVAAEVLFTRLLSVATWYGLAFLVLSVAMLGTTRGALDASAAQMRGAPFAPWIAGRLVAFAALLGIATVIVLAVPLTFNLDATSLFTVLLVVSAITAPMVAAGGVVARLMAEADVRISTLYAVDLVAAAVGAMSPLVLLGPLTGPSAMLAIALLAAATAAWVAKGAVRRGAVSLCVGLVLLVGLGQLTNAGLVLKYTKGVPRADEGAPVFEKWNALSHVALSSFAPAPFPLWSASPAAVVKNHPVATALIDGEAGTAVYAFGAGKVEKLEGLKNDAITIAHALRSTGTACVIGIGGGRDLESALVYGHDHVVGVEINPSMVEMLRKVAPYSPILDDPRVEVIVGDGRTELARRPIACRVLQASLVDTWAATSAGAFAHAESTLYTREAWATFLKRVEPDGVLTFSRWYDPANVSETSRLLALAVASLLDRGVPAPESHIALIAAGRVATILVSPAPFSPEDRAKLTEVTTAMRLTTLLSPDVPPKDAILSAILATRNVSDLADAGAELSIDTSAPTDDRPFFFQLLSPRAWLHPTFVAREVKWHKGAMAGNVASAFQLLLTFLSVSIVTIVLLGPTLRQAARDVEAPLPGPRPVVYFGALGAGFMLAEIGLVQRMHVVLGHPTYALVIVLAGLLVATGVGSALSSRVVRTRRAVSLAAGSAAVLLALLPWGVIGPLARATADAPFAAKIGWTFSVAVVTGLNLGLLFPSALAYVERVRGAPVALAVNGAAGVLGSVVAVTVSVWGGIPACFVVAAALYFIAAAFGPQRWREARPTVSGEVPRVHAT